MKLFASLFVISLSLCVASSLSIAGLAANGLNTVGNVAGAVVNAGIQATGNSADWTIKKAEDAAGVVSGPILGSIVKAAESTADTGAVASKLTKTAVDTSATAVSADTSVVDNASGVVSNLGKTAVDTSENVVGALTGAGEQAAENSINWTINKAKVAVDTSANVADNVGGALLNAGSNVASAAANVVKNFI